MLRMEKMSLLLIRWIAYHELAMEDYKSFHPDADPENELESLLKKSKDLSDLRYEDMRDYHDKLVNFFSFIRGKVLKVTKGDKIVTEFIMSHDEIDKLDEKIQKIDELRKKVP